jgi:hypothetical protein
MALIADSGAIYALPCERPRFATTRPFTSADVNRSHALLKTYTDLDLGLADASVIVTCLDFLSQS